MGGSADRRACTDSWRARKSVLCARNRVLLSSYVYLLYCVCIAGFTLVAGLLARSQYSEGPATGHPDTGFSRFPCAYKQTLRRFPTFPVATTCFSCSPPDLNLVVTNFMFCLHVKYPLPPGDKPIAVNKYYYYYYYYYYYMFRAGLLLIIRRYCSVYTTIGIYLIYFT